MILSIGLSVLCSQSPPAPVLTVDWDGSGDHLTISSALLDPSITPGAKIYIRGLSDSQGQPIAYSERGPDPSAPSILIPMETFPLVVPEGVQLIRLPGSPPPWIWSDGSAGVPAAVVRILDSPTVSASTLLKGLRIVSASTGVEVTANGTTVGSSPSLDLEMRNMYFGGSTVGLNLTAGNGHLIKAELVDCSHVHFGTSSLNLVNPPSLKSPEVGFRFHTFSNSGNTNGGGQVEVRIQNLQAQSAAYPSQPRQFIATTDFALAGVTPSASRLIEFYAWGEDESLDHPADLIPSIDAELLGCDLNGRKDVLAGWGWDIGVYATTRARDGEPNGTAAYHSGFRSRSLDAISENSKWRESTLAQIEMAF
jgi:hypothetical protein